MKTLLKVFLFLLFSIVSTAGIYAQKTVTGTVVDKNQQPVPAANVVITGTAKGTTTDFAGKYSISVPQNAKSLTFSYVGMEPQVISIGSLTQINVTLSDSAIDLDEVVVVGYGSQKKVNLTGAVETVRVQELKSRPLTNVSSALQGKIAGAYIRQNSGQPGKDDATILIRGLGTFNDSSPLVIIDGMQGALNDVNPKDVESISVLKDAASCAIYGNRAANGVILITTKRGQTDKMQLDYTGYYGVQSVTSMPEVLKGVEYLDLLAVSLFNQSGQYPGWYNDEYMNNYRNNVDPIRYPTDFDWVNAVFSPAPMKDNHLNFSGGNKTFQYSAALGYLDQSGIVMGNSSKKLSLRTNLTGKFLNEKLTIDLNMSGHNQVTDDMVNGMSNAMYFVFVNASTTPMEIPGYGYTGGAYNWAAAAAGGYSRQKGAPLNVRLAANFNILPGWDVNASYGIYKDSYENERFAPTVKTYSYKTDGSILETIASEQTGLRTDMSESVTKTANAQTSYTRELFNKFQFTILGGFESREFRNDYSWLSRQNFSANLAEMGIGDPGSMKNGGGAAEVAWLSGYGRINLAYQGKYLLEATLRRDGSSRFLEKWGTFPSASVGWRISEESFIKDNVDQITNLKIRASWGRLGNEGIGQYYAASDELSLSLSNNFGNAMYPAAAITKLANKKTSWETSQQLNFGFDFGLFKNKLSGTFDYFVKENSDILMQIPISSTLGLSTVPYQNLGAMKNTGFEIQLSYSGNINEVNINANLAAAHTTNEITSLAGQKEIIFNNLIWREGQEYNSFYAYASEGIYQSQAEINSHLRFTDDKGVSINPYVGLTPYPGDIKFTDQNGDKIINVKDKVLIGKPFPDWTFSTTVNVEWRNFYVSLFFQGCTGMNSLNRFMVTVPFHGGVGATGVWYRDAWTPEKPSQTIQRLSSDPTRFEIDSDYYLEDNSYIRLKNIEIGYTIPESVTKKLKINSIRIFADIQNAWTATKMRYGFDPEKPNTTTTTLQYPQTRIISTGINVKF